MDRLPSLVISIAALFVALGGVGYAATGGTFVLGASNSALNSGVTTGASLNVVNTGGRPTTRFTVNAGIAPFSVNTQTKSRA